MATKQKGPRGASSRKRKRVLKPLPFVIMAPAAVVLLGAGVALVVLMLGMQRLDRRALESAEFRAELLAQMVAAQVVERAERRKASTAGRVRLTRAELERAGLAGILLNGRGQTLLRAGAGPAEPALQLPPAASGPARLGDQVARYVTIPLSASGAELGRRALGSADTHSEETLLLSVLSPLGAALLSCREGEQVRIVGTRASRALVLDKIEFQPEREGKFDL